MLVSTYTMYMDESETKKSDEQRYFVIGGLIIKNEDYTAIEQSLMDIKKLLWVEDVDASSYILHEKDVSFASSWSNRHRLNEIPSYNKIFTKKRNVLTLYNEISKIFRLSPVVTLGVCLDKKALFDSYGEQHLNNQFTIAIQLMIEHYCQFLSDTKSTGDICYEAMQPEQNMKIQQRMYELKALGTMYYSPATIQNHLREIKFVQKSDNYAGLQLADFIPNTLARYAANLKPKNQSLSENIRSKLYCGKNGVEKMKYGFKILS